MSLGSLYGLSALLLGAIWPPLGVAMVGLLATYLVLSDRQAAARIFVSAYIVLAFLRNSMLAVLPRLRVEVEHAALAQGLDFLLVAAAGGLGLLIRMQRGDENPDTALFTGALVAIACWTIFGWAQSSLQEAAYYGRLASYFVLAFAVGSYLRGNAGEGARLIENCIIVVGWLCALFVLFEHTVPVFLYKTFAVHDYLSAKYGIVLGTPADAVDFNTRRLFNLPSAVTVKLLRPMGLTLHTISSGYLVGAGVVVCLVTRRWTQATVLAAILLSIGAKGPILVTGLAAWGGLLAVGRWGTPVYALQVATTIVLLLLVGLISKDVHTVSLLTSIHELPANPLGSGLGVAGSVGQLTEIGEWDWTVRGDSALAALVSMMGIAAVLPGAAYVRIMRATTQLRLQERHRFGMLWLIALLAGLVFQEEGLAPAAVGLAAMYAGACWRPVAGSNRPSPAPAAS